MLTEGQMYRQKKTNKVSDEQIVTAPLPDKCDIEVDVNSDDEIPENSIDFDVTEELKNVKLSRIQNRNPVRKICPTV